MDQAEVFLTHGPIGPQERQPPVRLPNRFLEVALGAALLLGELDPLVLVQVPPLGLQALPGEVTPSRLEEPTGGIRDGPHQ